MNITKDQTSELTATIQISIEKADYENDVNKELKDYQRKASMPGFRPGKVPFGMVKKMYGNAVTADKVNKLISEALNNYIIENKLPLLGHPIANLEKTSTVDFDKDENLDFFFDIGLAPSFDLDFEGMEKPEYIKIEATDESIDKVVANMLERNQDWEEVESVEEGDMLELKLFEVDEEGKEVENGFEETIKLNLDEITEESRKMFVGKPSGDEFVYKLAEAFETWEAFSKKLGLDDSANDLANKPFNIIINTVERKKVAELNEELFEAVYPNEEIKTTEDFRKRIARDIEMQHAADTDRYFFNKVVEAMISHHKFEMPDAFMKSWMVDNSEGKVTADEIEKDYEEKYAKAFRWQLMQGKLESEHAEELEVRREEIRNHIKAYFFGRMMGSEGIDEEMDSRMDGIVDTIIQNKDEERKIREQIGEKKLIDFLRKTINPSEKTMSYDDFIKLATEKNESDE